MTDQSTAAELAQLIAERIQAFRGRKDVAQIASEAGFGPGDIISLLATGEAKLSIDNTLQLAVALEVDPFRMFRLALGQYWRESMLDAVFHRVVSPGEFQIIAIIREASQGHEPALTPKKQKALRQLFHQESAP